MNAQQILLAGPYNLFYAAAFFAAFGLAYWRGTRAAVPAGRLSSFLLLCAIAGVLGSRFLPFDLSAVEVGEKTVLGGVFALAMVALAARSILRLDAEYTDALAIALPVGLAIGRIGCFLAGCCAGTPTDLPWGVRYEEGAHAVHPTQLYEAAGALLLALAAHFQLRTRRNILIPGVVLPFLALRFALQFLRGDGGFGTTHVLLLLSAVLLWGAHDYARRCPERAAVPHAWLPATAAMACLVLLAARGLTPLEAVTLASLALLSGVLILVTVSSSARRMLPAFASVIAVQQVDTTTRQAPRHFVTAGASAMRGQYVESCGGAHRYAMGGASVAYTTIPSPNVEWSAKAQVFTGSDESADTLAPPAISVAGAGVLLRGRYKWVGGTIGVLGGNLYYDGESASILPILGVRLGPPEFYAEGRFADFEPAPVPTPMLQLGIGTRISPQGSELRFGVSPVGAYANALMVLGAWEIEPGLALGEEDSHLFGIAVRRRIGLAPLRNR